MASSRGSPTPAACERTSELCSACKSSRAILVEASRPKPVLMPYTVRPSAIRRSTVATLASMASAAPASSVSRTGSWYTRRKSDKVR